MYGFVVSVGFTLFAYRAALKSYSAKVLLMFPISRSVTPLIHNR